MARAARRRWSVACGTHATEQRCDSVVHLVFQPFVLSPLRVASHARVLRAHSVARVKRVPVTGLMWCRGCAAEQRSRFSHFAALALSVAGDANADLINDVSNLTFEEVEEQEVLGRGLPDHACKVSHLDRARVSHH